MALIISGILGIVVIPVRYVKAANIKPMVVMTLINVPKTKKERETL